MKIIILMFKLIGMFVIVCVSVLLFSVFFVESGEMVAKTGNIEYYAIIFFFSAIYAGFARKYAPFLFYYSDAYAEMTSILLSITGIVIFVYGFYLRHGGPPLF